MEGHILINKKIIKSWVFEKPHVFKTWLWMLCTASTNKRIVDWHGQQINVEAGQLVSGRNHIMSALSLSQYEAVQALKELVEDKAISIKSHSNYSIITINNFLEYQGVSSVIDAPERAKYTAGFDAFWNAYPRKQGKAKAMEYWRRDRLSNKSKEIMDALSLFVRSDDWLRDGGKFIPFASTWLNQKRYLDAEYLNVKKEENMLTDLPEAI